MKTESSFCGKQILITGGMGYLSSNLIDQLKDIDCKIIRLDRPGASFLPFNGQAKVQNIEGDIRDRAILETALADVDIVFHFAAQTSIYVAEENPILDYEINVLPMLHILKTCHKKQISPIIIFAGTVTEFGLTESLPVNESHPDYPITIYDMHKLMAENYLRHYIKKGYVRGAVLRLANVYGPGPTSSSTDRGILNMMIRKALQGETLTVYGTGNFVRDYIYVDDVVSAFLNAIIPIEQLNGQHFVIGSGQGHTVTEAINLVADRVAFKNGLRVPVVHNEPPASLSPIESRNFVADTMRYSKATNWKARVSLIEGIDRTIESFLKFKK